MSEFHVEWSRSSPSGHEFPRYLLGFVTDTGSEANGAAFNRVFTMYPEDDAK